MLELQTLTLFNVKKYIGLNIIDFSESESKIITISGNNGSGKTTILHALMISQMAFFIKSNYLEMNFSELVSNYNCYEAIKQELNQDDSYIEIKFLSDNIPCGFKLYNKQEYGDPWGIEYSSTESLELIQKYWNLSNPSCLFFCLCSDKHYSEESVSYEKIMISKKTKIDFLLDYILGYSSFPENMYQMLMNDHIKERLIPGSPRYDIYFVAARALYSYLIPEINLGQFVGAKNPEFQLMVRNDRTSKNNFDIRYLSSGEKTIFYLCLLLNYFRSIGLLLIDEPENHLHENLLYKLLSLLSEVISSTSYVDILRKYSKETIPSYIENYYKDYHLQKVIFVTHSKSLIYSNFQFGQNYVINNGIEKLEYENSERLLRESGLSSVYENILVVEGSTEEKLFDHVLDDEGIHIVTANGCDQLLGLYRKVKELKDYLHSTNFVFMIDRDTKNKEKFEKVRNENPDFYDSHFVLLDKHEIENYFIDKELLFDLCEKYKLERENIYISSIELSSIIDCAVVESKECTEKKEINEKLHDYIIDLASKVKQKEICIQDKQSFMNYINPIFDDIHQEYYEAVSNIFETIENKYKNWESQKYDLCDGKKVYVQIKKLYRIN